ncbi:hypothetical protein Vi05172_g10847 [Venturia inaequalis]|nr:hypothetical protein Vi05172_g10847 [Venturia inaequalis]
MPGPTSQAMREQVTKLQRHRLILPEIRASEIRVRGGRSIRHVDPDEGITLSTPRRLRHTTEMNILQRAELATQTQTILHQAGEVTVAAQATIREREMRISAQATLEVQIMEAELDNAITATFAGEHETPRTPIGQSLGSNGDINTSTPSHSVSRQLLSQFEQARRFSQTLIVIFDLRGYDPGGFDHQDPRVDRARVRVRNDTYAVTSATRFGPGTADSLLDLRWETYDERPVMTSDFVQVSILGNLTRTRMNSNNIQVYELEYGDGLARQGSKMGDARSWRDLIDRSVTLAGGTNTRGVNVALF